MALASLILATLAFVGGHFLLSHRLRLTLIGAVGELRFTLLYSLVAIATLLWAAFAWLALDGEMPVWIAPGWCWPIASAIMLLASILLIGSFVRNPAFPNPGAARETRPASGIFAITRHPMNWAFALWAVVHLILWGSARNIVLDGGILILAVFGSIGQDGKKERSIGQPWLQWEAKTSFVPFAALLAGRAHWRDIAKGWGAMLGGLVFWLAFTLWHVPAHSPITWARTSLL